MSPMDFQSSLIGGAAGGGEVAAGSAPPLQRSGAATARADIGGRTRADSEVVGEGRRGSVEGVVDRLGGVRLIESRQQQQEVGQGGFGLATLAAQRLSHLQQQQQQGFQQLQQSKQQLQQSHVLTRDQLKQTLVELISTDAAFLEAIHDAYVTNVRRQNSHGDDARTS